MMIKAVIFDMDGLLIDSEPLWREVEVKVFNQLGVPLTEKMTYQTIGRRSDEVIEHWFLRYPWKGTSKEEVDGMLVSRIIEMIKEKGKPMPGAVEILNKLKQVKMPMAIASSSVLSIIKAVTEKLQISHYFQVIHSAEHEEYGKPHPGVYISTAKKLGVGVEECLAFEDSPNGVLAAKSARMVCIAVPSEEVINSPKFCIADKKIATLKDFDTRDLANF